MNGSYDDWQNDPRNYKWGIFYFNPRDNRLIVPKRIPYLGWTLNFANKYAFAVIFGILTIALLSSLIQAFK